MPNHYNPYNPYGYFRPTGKEHGAMAIGSLLAGLLAASQPRQRGEASPFIKGVAGATSGYGDAYKNFLNIKGDEYERNMKNRSYDQKLKEYEETTLPESRAKVNYYNQRDIPDYNKIRDERVGRRLDIKRKRRELNEPVYAPGEKDMLDFEFTNRLNGLPPEKLTQLRKHPEYIKALYAFRKQNMMNTAEPFVMPTEGSETPIDKVGLWDYIKDRFSTNTSAITDTVSKGVNEAMGNKLPMEEIPDPAQNKGKLLTDIVAKKRFISDGISWKPIP